MAVALSLKRQVKLKLEEQVVFAIFTMTVRLGGCFGDLHHRRLSNLSKRTSPQPL